MIDWHEIVGIQHYKTLKKIFLNPTPSDIPWPDIQNLLEELKVIVGGRIDVVYGGRICVKLDDGKPGVIHQADLGKHTAIGNVRAIQGIIETIKKEALVNVGVRSS